MGKPDKIVIISPTLKHKDPWIKALKAQHPGLAVQVFPEDTNRKDTEFLLVWNPPEGVFLKYPNLKVISSIAAGVTHVLKDSNLPEGVRIIKMNDDLQKQDLAEFVLSLLFNRMRRLEEYARYQAEKHWRRHAYQRPAETTVGIMGIGNIGQAIGRLLVANHFTVTGWSRTRKTLKNITIYYGEEQKKDFLKTADFLVCILPLTQATRGILNANVFAQLPKGAYLINVGRGSHLVDEDLIAALDNGSLSGAALDTFREEPLPEDHPFWEHEKILITPHTASSVSPQRVAEKIIRNFYNLQKGEPLEDEIDRDRGY